MSVEPLLIQFGPKVAATVVGAKGGTAGWISGSQHAVGEAGGGGGQGLGPQKVVVLVRTWA
jgi:hypothetical protein